MRKLINFKGNGKNKKIWGILCVTSIILFIVMGIGLAGMRHAHSRKSNAVGLEDTEKKNLTENKKASKENRIVEKQAKALKPKESIVSSTVDNKQGEKEADRGETGTSAEKQAAQSTNQSEEPEDLHASLDTLESYEQRAKEQGREVITSPIYEEPQSPEPYDISPQWLLYESKCSDAITPEQKQVIDAQVDAWMHGEMTEQELSTWMTDYLWNETGYEENSALIGVYEKQPQISKKGDDMSVYKKQVEDTKMVYYFIAIYTDGEWTPLGHLKLWKWEASIC